MKELFHFTAPLLALITMVACAELEVSEDANDAINNGILQELSITGKDFIFDDETRSTVAIGDGGASFTWDEDDVIGIFPDKGDQVSFAMDEGAGTQTATFSGGGWALKSSAKYAAYYPHVYENRDMTKIPVSYVGQTQNGNANTDHIGAYDFMAAGVSTPENGAVAFDMQHLGALVQLTITVPEPSTLTKVVLTSSTGFTETGTIDLTADTPTIIADTQSNTLEITLNNVTATDSDKNVTIYFMTAPVDLKESELTAKVHFADETIYETEITGKTLQAGKAYRLTSEIEEGTIPNNQIWYTANQEITPIYSGIETFGANIVSNEWDSVTGDGVITFDAEVTKIGDRAFSGYNTYCDQITRLTIPNSVTAIGYGAFQYCENLTNFIIPNNVTIIGYSAFEKCYSLVSVTIGDSVSEIGHSAFYLCESLTSVTIPDGVTTIGGNAFYACDKLESFKGKYAEDNGRVLIKDNKLIAYANASGTSYTIPNYVTSIGECAFYYCGNLVSVTIPESVTIIEDGAFFDCRGLKSVTIIGHNLTSIGYEAFAGCDYLESITLPNSVTDIMDMAFCDCKSLKGITIPENLTAIKSQLFYHCSSLTTLTIPKTVTSIGDKAFSYCESLMSVTLSENVTTIGSEAFYNCTSLTEAYVRAATPPSLGHTAFTNCSDNLTIYVPIKSLNAYTSAYNWKNLNIEIIIKAVDLGLSVKWANCNLGANGPEEYGNYYAWGEINTKTDYTPGNSMSWNIPYSSCPLNSEGNLILAWDAAYKTWGNSWRMPTKVELDELKNNCKWEWSTLNGVKGYTVTSKINGNSIFLPSNDSSVIDNKETGFGSYWSSTPCSDTTFDSKGRYAGAIGFYAKDYNISENVRIQSDYFLRWCKRGIRPVYNE